MPSATSFATRERLERIRHVLPEGIEYWNARELAATLGYKWREFLGVIRKARQACETLNMNPEDHFVASYKKVIAGAGTPSKSERDIPDYRLDRPACYFIAQNGNPKLQAIAEAQAYFTMQTLRQEQSDDQHLLDPGAQRLKERSDFTRHFKTLNETASRSGVSNFGFFNGAGIRGMYTMNVSEVKKRKGIPDKDQLMDRIGTVELAAHNLRVTLAEEQLRRTVVRSQQEAEKAHQDIGRRVRNTVTESIGVPPENLPAETHIKELKKHVEEERKRLAS